MEQRVVITGMGVISPVGNNINDFWTSLAEGRCGIDHIKGFEEYELPISVAGQVKDFAPEENGLERNDIRRNDLYCQFALAAAYQAMQQSGLKSGENVAADRLGVYIGSGIGGMNTFVNETTKLLNEGVNRISPLFVPMMIGNIAAGNVAIKYNAQGVCLPVVTACATGTHAAGEAYRAIKHGYADAIIAGGAEASIHPLAIGGFANSKALTRSTDPKNASIPFSANRNGFVMGEGAGVLVFESLENAQKRGAKIYAEVVGYGNSCDAHHVTAPSPDGVPASRAIKQSLAEAGFDAEKDLLYINAHGTSTPLNDKSETAAIKLAMGEEAAHKAMISSTKSMTGHMLGATGAVELIACVLTLENGVVPPTIGLNEPDPECDLDYVPNVARKADVTIAISNSLGFGGHNSCVALRKWNG
ncbi:MAG: beta-ketoacyl-ACP synthase II [Alistipes sp.]|nr:beta-ketoacyl-ACP synthase II [Alistipes sp.]MBP3473658.1 beta-ketoacyl-ACP synthase II [Alistipes sp.]MBR3793178.1 beta-ketoacyl-ACP synthase II [Alistipes sp.]